MPVFVGSSLLVDYTDDGVGRPVILLHSSVSGNRQWRKLTEALRDRYRVIAPNLYGYGKTTAWTDDRGPQLLEDAVQPVLVVLDSIDGPVSVVGHSWGGAVALKVAAMSPERISRLVLIEPMLPATLREHACHGTWPEVESLYRDVKRLGGAGRWEELAKRFTMYFNGDGAWEATPPDRRSTVAEMLRPNYFEWDFISQPITTRWFEGISAPTLLMRSLDTRPALHDMVELLRQAFPHWEFVEVGGGGHMAPLTRPDLVNPVIARFLDAS